MDHAVTMRSTYERINKGDIAGFGDLVAEDFVEHQGAGGPGFPPTKEGTLEFFRTLLAAFPDWRMTVEDLIAGGDKTVARVTVTTVIVELHAKPGRRDELRGVLESLIATQGPGQDGFLGSTRYGVLDDPDVLVEIADWESADAREAHMHEAAATGAYAPLLELLAAPFRVTVISQLP